jgi:Zn-dependent peptidase ImmA (M78 family)/transcriptional regulator with XRE-family HTH domain
MTASLIGTRIKALREEKGLSQDDLARMFGFKDRQTVSAIETGERRVSAEELLTAVAKLGASLDYFTDPFLLAGDGKFSWRRHPRVGLETVKAFERVAGRWIAADRTLAGQVGKPAPILRQSLKLTSKSSFEEAMEAGERFTADFKLAPVPAEKLPEVMERKLGILVLMVDASDGVSGAACRLPDLDAVLINRHEVAGRRNFDLAHELFHILTWDTMPPEYLEEATEYSKIRVEQLANNFASALLMPQASLKNYERASTKANIISWLNATADKLQVTATALKWRLVALGWLDDARAKEISDEALRYNGRSAPTSDAPPLFSKSFMEVLGQAINEGRISARRAANLLDLKIEDLAELFTVHAVEAPLDL